ncbi:CRTAC1 family protein, partial [Candidatus Neomarinimicrobiota bacterium]
LHIANGSMYHYEYDEDDVNLFYHNNGDGSFTEMSAISGLDDHGDGRASAVLDINNDGYSDLIMINVWRGDIQLYRNNNSGNNWITFHLVGTTSNRNGIGTRIKLEAGSLPPQLKELNPGTSYGSSSSIRLGFGLGQESLVDRITIRWPSGTIQELYDVSVNQILTITEPKQPSVR